MAETSYTPFASEPDAVPVRLIVRSECSPRPTPSWPSWSTTAITASSPIETATPWNWRPIIAATPRSRTPSATSSTGWVSTTCPRAASPPTPPGWPSKYDGPQPGPLDHAPRAGCADGNHQDPPVALLLPGRTHHPQGATPHPASATGLALAKPIQQRSGSIARPAAPLLTATTASDPSAAPPDCLADLRQVGPRVSPAAICTLISPVAGAAARQKSPSRR